MFCSPAPTSGGDPGSTRAIRIEPGCRGKYFSDCGKGLHRLQGVLCSLPMAPAPRRICKYGLSRGEMGSGGGSPQKTSLVWWPGKAGYRGGMGKLGQERPGGRVEEEEWGRKTTLRTGWMTSTALKMRPKASKMGPEDSNMSPVACQTGTACIAEPGTTNARPESDIPRWPPPEVWKSSNSCSRLILELFSQCSLVVLRYDQTLIRTCST